MAIQVETPSGKTAKDENFPVGSKLLASRKRPHVAAYYAFARAIDDIADNPELEPDDKILRLKAMGEALETGDGDAAAFGTAHRLRASLLETGVSFAHALDLIVAFKHDARMTNTGDWLALLDYCRFSAAPVGRYLLDLHGESRTLWPAVDALCSALQVLNHLQDCAKDYRDLGRVYLPADWMRQEGAALDDLTRPATTPALRRVIDHCLDGVDELLALARLFPRRLDDRRLATESAVIVALACRLAKRLRSGDPLAARVGLTRADFVACGAQGVASFFLPRFLCSRADLVPPRTDLEFRLRGDGEPAVDRLEAPFDHVSSVVRRSGSSFTAGMRILPRDRRQAMYAIYAFCREVDDAADEPNPPEVKLALLDGWRREIAAVYDGAPERPTGCALHSVVRRYDLPRDEFVAIIDGMEMDLLHPLHGPDLATLRLYCRRVAGAVGLLSLGPFGASGPGPREFAIALGEALQFTNILRDVEEDGKLGRLYLPREVLEPNGINRMSTADAVLHHPNLDAACRDLVRLARARFAEADAVLERCDRRALRPALLMMGIYEDLLDRLEKRGWSADLRRMSAGPLGKLRAALTKGLFRPQRCSAAKPADP